GLSVKNAVLYMIAFGVFFRVALSGGERVYLPSIHIAFVLLIGYATLTWLVAALVIHYPGYRLVAGLISLKTRMIDPALMLFAALYALREMRDVRVVLMFLLAAIGIANVATLADLVGIVHLGMRVGDKGAEAGRVFGAFGHANETAALLVCVLPAMIVSCFHSRGFLRLVWIGFSVASSLVLLLTVSRGAFVGLAIGGLTAAYLCRRHVPFQRFVMLGFATLIGVAFIVLVAGLVDSEIGSTLAERLLGQSGSVDVGEASSGRTGIWAALLQKMMTQPITLLTGFGWAVYYVMPFRYAPHNFYLGMWFDLGIVCVGLIMFIFIRSLLAAYRAVDVAEPDVRDQLLAFVFGVCSLVVAIVFADLFTPWPYIWLYVGVVLKMAVLARSEADDRETARRPQVDTGLRVASPFRGSYATTRR
ncbi:MAG TPA: O-antigen ligase family protein, partial [Steroidobacteraceae bacterium]|nr:O-antigen ligase family protein [Steroidobacteraceae bacterium]